jgi:hypothetical protein
VVADSAAGAPVVRAGDLFGLYWEQYASAAPRRTVSITATRMGATAWERLGTLVGRAIIAQPVSLRYRDPVPDSAGPGRYVALRWPVVPPGTYRLTVTVSDAAPDSVPRAGEASGAVTGDTGTARPAVDTTAVDTTAIDRPASDGPRADTVDGRPPESRPAAPAGTTPAATLIVRVVR